MYVVFGVFLLVNLFGMLGTSGLIFKQAVDATVRGMADPAKAKRGFFWQFFVRFACAAIALVLVPYDPTAALLLGVLPLILIVMMRLTTSKRA